MADGGWSGPDRLNRVRAWLDRHIRGDRSNPWARHPPWGERLALGAAVVVVSVVVLYALAPPDRDTGPFEAVDATSSTAAPTTSTTAAPLTTTSMSPTTVVVPTTVTVTTVAAPTTTRTTRPPVVTTTVVPRTTVRPAATPTSAATRFTPLCGYVPGARIDIELNGQPVGTETADENGCVPVTIDSRR